MASREESVSAESRSDSRSRSHSPAPHRRHSRSSRHSDSRSASPAASSSRRTNGRAAGGSSSGGGGSGGRTHRSRSPMSNRRRHVGTRDDPLPSRCLGVFGLNLDTKESVVTRIFGRFGTLRKVQIVVDAKSRRSRGFGFVYYEAVEAATAAKEECSGMEIEGRRIRVDYSITDRAHTPTPGIYMGRPTTSDRGYGAGYGGGSYGGGASGYSRGGPSGYREREPRYRTSRSPDRRSRYQGGTSGYGGASSRRSARGSDYYGGGSSSSRYDSYGYDRRDDRDRGGYERYNDRYDGRGNGEYHGSASGYDRSYDRGYDRGYDRDRSRSRSASQRRYR